MPEHVVEPNRVKETVLCDKVHASFQAVVKAQDNTADMPSRPPQTKV